MNTSNTLRSWRKAQGWSLDEAAQLTGISKTMLSQVERGVRHFRPAMKIQVARCLGAQVRDLFLVVER